MLQRFIGEHSPLTLKNGSTVTTVDEFNNLCHQTGTDGHRPRTVDFMRKVIRLKLEQNKEARDMALECARDGIIPIEVSQHDKTWASGNDGLGKNWLGLVILEQANQLQKETVEPAIKDPWQRYQDFQKKLNPRTQLSHGALVNKVNSSIRTHSIQQAAQWGAPGKKTISIAETRRQDPVLAAQIEKAVKTELQTAGYRVDNGNNLKLVHEENGISHDFSEPQKQKVEMGPGCAPEDVVRELIKVRAAIERAKQGISSGQKLESTSFKSILIDGKEVEASIIKKVAFEFYNSVTLGGDRFTAGNTEAEDFSQVDSGQKKREERFIDPNGSVSDDSVSCGSGSDEDDVTVPQRNDMLFNEMRRVDVKTKRCELASQLNMSAKKMLDEAGGEEKLKEFIVKNMLARAEKQALTDLKKFALDNDLLKETDWDDRKTYAENSTIVSDIITASKSNLSFEEKTELMEKLSLYGPQDEKFIIGEVEGRLTSIKKAHQAGGKDRSELIKFNNKPFKYHWMVDVELHVFAKLLNVRFELESGGGVVSHYGDANAAVIKMTHTSGAEGGHYCLSGDNTAADGRCGWTGILQGLVAIPESSYGALTPLAQDLIRKTNACRDELTPKQSNKLQWRRRTRGGGDLKSASDRSDDEGSEYDTGPRSFFGSGE